MNPALVTSLAAVGLGASWAQRAVILRYAVPAREPPLRTCAGCGQQLLAVPQIARAPLARCTACGEPAGPPPMTVEATTVILLAALAARVHPALVLVAACWLALCAVPLAFTDIAVRRLPDTLTGPALAGTAALLTAAAAADGDWTPIARAALGAAALSGFLLLLALISPSGMGLGDAKAAPALGALLAWHSWAALLAGSLAGVLLAAHLITRHATRKHQDPLRALHDHRRVPRHPHRRHVGSGLGNVA